MEFMEKLTALTKKIKMSSPSLLTEEATKNALIMPFLSSVLGYDVFDPTEVIPEFTADVGIKKGEKVDYAIVKNGKIQMLVECKRYGEQLSVSHASQLYRYFSVTDARIGVLTNGAKYQFFTDLDASNKMDEKPFLEIDLENIDENVVPELQKITKNEFDVGAIINSAGELKYLQQIKKIVGAQFAEPEDEFVRFFTSRCYDGKATQKVIEQFKKFTSTALSQFISDKVNERLKSAMEKADPAPPQMETEIIVQATDESEHVLAISPEELEAFNIIRAIACQYVDIRHIFYRLNQSYLSVIFDDNNRKPICRLYLKKENKYIGWFDEKKEEHRTQIGKVEEIFKCSNHILEVLRVYLPTQTAPS